MNTVVLGGTKGMGRALARALAMRGHRIFLLGRNEEELARSARDLEVRAGLQESIGTAVCDLERPETFVCALEAAAAWLGAVDLVVVTAGVFVSQPFLERDLSCTRRLLTVDFCNTVLFCEHARQRLLGRGGTLCVFSSVAGERARSSVVLYGAAKAGLSAYLEGLDHRYHRAGLRVVCVKPGFVRTSMTDGLAEPPFAANPEDIVARVLKAIEKAKPVVYGPPIWGPIMQVVRLLPRAVMRRTTF